MPKTAAPKKPKAGVDADTIKYAQEVTRAWADNLSKKAKAFGKTLDFANAAVYDAAADLVLNGDSSTSPDRKEWIEPLADMIEK